MTEQQLRVLLKYIDARFDELAADVTHDSAVAETYRRMQLEDDLRAAFGLSTTSVGEV